MDAPVFTDFPMTLECCIKHKVAGEWKFLTG